MDFYPISNQEHCQSPFSSDDFSVYTPLNQNSILQLSVLTTGQKSGIVFNVV
jgi:hypothetical protein